MKKLFSIISLVLIISNNAARDAKAAAIQAARKVPRIACTIQAKKGPVPAAPAAPAEYRRLTTVYSLEPADDVVIVVDSDGELWDFYGVEDWHVGDYCELTMIDAGISNYQWDDEITLALYKGVNESFE